MPNELQLGGQRLFETRCAATALGYGNGRLLPWEHPKKSDGEEKIKVDQRLPLDRNLRASICSLLRKPSHGKGFAALLTATLASVFHRRH